jgi:excisionase family DNA binding protein
MLETTTREPLLVSKRRAAEALSVSVRTVENLIVSKKLPSRKIGRRTLIPYSALRALASRDTPSPSRSTSKQNVTVVAEPHR